MKIGIIGLGLIGGSIFKKLTELNYDVIGISQSQKGKNIYNDINKLIDCNIVFVCSPMNKTLEILDKLNLVLDKETIVTDVCSLKEFVSKKEYNYRFIPSHPMAGTEHKGFENSFAEMFKNAKWVITPIKEKSEELENLIKQMGAEIIYTTPIEHDKAASLISHMPMLLAQAIFKNAQDNELALNMASSGFRDMTRLAMSNPEMANDMISMNSENIQNAILTLYQNIGELTNKNYYSQIVEIKNKRDKMFLK